jgi:hypothetical protein
MLSVHCHMTKATSEKDNYQNITAIYSTIKYFEFNALFILQKRSYFP